MIRRGLIAAALVALALSAPAIMAQVNPGTTPLTGQKGGTGNAFMQFSGPASSLKTFTLPNASGTIAVLNAIETWTGAQSFTDGTSILLGSSSGSVVLHAPATSGGAVTFFIGSDTVVGRATTDTLTNKTIASSTDVIGSVTMGLGSDATGDIYYNNGGVLTRLPKGSNGQALELVTGLPAWVTVTGAGTVTTPGGGLVSSTTAACSQTAGQTTLSAAECVNAQSGTSYAIQDSDRAKLITATNNAAQAYTIAQAGASTTFQSGWFTEIANLSGTSSGIITLTPTTSTINGNSTLVLYPGERAKIVSDGTNYQASYIVAINGPWHLLNTLTASNSAALTDTTSITAAFTEYEVVLEQILPATTNQTLHFQFQVSASFQTSSYLSSAVFGSGSATNSTLDTAGVQVGSVTALPNTAPGINGRFLLSNPAQTLTCKMMLGDWAYVNSTIFVGTTGGCYNGGSAAITGIRLISTSGNLTSGVMKIYGRVN